MRPKGRAPSGGLANRSGSPGRMQRSGLHPASQRARDRRCPSRIGLGRSSRIERSTREVPSQGLTRSRHGPWPVTSRLAAARAGARESSARSRRGRRKPPRRKARKPPAAKRCSRGRPRARWAGFGRCAVVLADCFDCRSRRAARGPLPIRPAGEEPVDRSGSSLQRESSGGEGASEAGSRAANPRDRWRARCVRESGQSRALVDGRRPGPGKPQSLTRLRWKRSWCFAEARFVRVEAGRETGRQRFSRRPCERPTTPSQWGLRPVGGAWPRARFDSRRGTAREGAEAGYAPSNACSPGVRIVERRSGATRHASPFPEARKGRVERGGERQVVIRGASRGARESTDPRVHVQCVGCRSR